MQKKRVYRLKILIAVAFTLWVTMLGQLALLTPAANAQPSDDNVVVPDVMGMTYLDAQAKLYALGLATARFIKVVESGQGLVVDQFPAAETQVTPGTKITLTVAQDSMPSKQDDGCVMQGKMCVCKDTGWERQCNYGPHSEGLYCQCD